MLELRNITIRIKSNERILVEDFSFTLKDGEKAAIIGEEGNGKSTLLKYLYDPGLVTDYCACTGQVLSGGRLGYLPQSLPEALFPCTLADYFDGLPWYLYTDALDRLGLDPAFLLSQQRLGTLSGGERVKVQLARLLMDEPDVLLLDEPTNDLDLDTLRFLEGFIRQSRLSILFISHDETLIERAADALIHMEQIGGHKAKCRISVSHASYREYRSFRQANFEHQAQVAQKQRDDYDRQMEKWRQIYNRVDHEQRTITRQDPGGARLLKKKMHSVLSMGRRFEREKENFLDFPQEESAILTQFDDNIRLPAGKRVLDLTVPELRAGEKLLCQNVRLTVCGGAHVGITGKNGAGKSTLLALLWEELKARPDLVCAYMPQDYAQALDYDKSPIDYLAENYPKDAVTKARTYLGCMRFTFEEMNGRIAALSGGQKAKLLFLEMVLRGANVLLLDEPTRNFSPLSAPVVRDALRRFGGAILSVSHDRKYLSQVCDEVYVLDESGLHRTEIAEE